MYVVSSAAIVDRIAAELTTYMREESVRTAQERGAEIDRRLRDKKAEIDQRRTQVEALKTRHNFMDLNEEAKIRFHNAQQLDMDLTSNASQLSAARARLNTVTAQRQPERNNGVSPTFNHLRQLEMSLESDELKARTEVAGLEAARPPLASSLEATRSQIPRPAVEAELNDLNLQLAVLESDYKKLATLREEVRATELLSKAEVYPLHQATPPDEPNRPVKVYHVLLSGLLALCLGICLVYLCDFVLVALRTPTPGGSPPSGASAESPITPLTTSTKE
jgi:uncharacterized protein involved in exopolysaccharide biosynthesis